MATGIAPSTRPWGSPPRRRANCYAKSLVSSRTIDPALVAGEKKRVVARGRGVTWEDPDPRGLEAVGGLDLIKGWLKQRRAAFGARARAYGLPAPKGVFLVGLPGTGKTLVSRCIASAWGLPLLSLDFGAIQSKYVGESQTNLRATLALLEAVAPCVVRVDEIEKALAGASGPAGDGGVAADALGTFLTWMQERKAPVFVVATANDVRALPPELLRKGRFDEVFFVDLPTRSEREGVLAAALAKHNLKGDGINLAEVARETEGYSGAELAALVPDAMFAAFADGERAITTADVLEAARNVVPLSKTASEKIETLRNWAKAAPGSRRRPKLPPRTKACERWISEFPTPALAARPGYAVVGKRGGRLPVCAPHRIGQRQAHRKKATMTIATSVIRPGILVALRTSVTGGITYNRVDLDADADKPAEEGASVARWETTKIVTDPKELERATKVRSEAVAQISKVCVRTSFGLLAPAGAEGSLDEAHAKARELVAAHNAAATHTKVEIHLLKGRIASTDEEAARAIASEVTSLLRDMERSVQRLDPESIRAAATKAAAMGAVLGEDKAAAVGKAVEAARTAARVIVKRVQKSGEDGARVLLDLQTGDIERARMSFLDMDEPAPVTANDADALPAVELQRTADLDLDEPEAPPQSAPGAEVAPASVPALDLDLDEPTPAPVAVEAAPAPVESGSHPDLSSDDSDDELAVFHAM
jgi:hypothetical protein